MGLNRDTAAMLVGVYRLSYFTAEKAKAQALDAEIERTDKEIDALVYALYGLTEAEIKVVEGK